jgi:hypothetical protein
MKRVFVLLGPGFLLAALSGCYTIVSNSNNVNGDVTNITVINYPPPPPVIDPIIVLPPPAPPYIERPVVTRPPNDRPKWNPSNGNRDPIRGHGEKGTTGHRNSDTIKRHENKTGNRR